VHFNPQLNPDLNFNNYVVGQSNKLAFTIADYIARNPRNSNFNPFFLFGDVGVGKTHLTQAIGIRIKEEHPKAKVFFTTAKQFQTLYANSVRVKKVPDFINWFSNIDVLLLDDLQEIAHMVKTTNDALFPVFNHLHQNGKQLVFTCDRPPMELDGIADRLIDRFKWGITEKLPRPDAELRRRILTFKARHNGLDLPEEVIELIAESATSSVRELEGIVMGILTRSITLNAPISLELAKEVMKNTIKTPVRKSVNFDMVVEATAEYYRLNPDVIFSKSRVRDVADARQVIMYLCNKLTGLSSVSIGYKLNRQHATVLHGISAIRERIDAVPEVAAAVEQIEHSIVN
ncbi:MAG: chromosomal replication initiator protein DnaA, partial [Muribaculaceae bacterium]|nr:chromosomal replication initiator protein DnaA [Muribaculaceae bacterium]